MPGVNERVAQDSIPAGPADYAAPALTVIGHLRDLTESHHHHHYHRHWGDTPGGLHPPGLPPPLFHGSA
jgi:hypothetical protein